ncbi:hypothetical protein PCL_10740 [Purpureocillium lilacinum]|uniref:Uncharacterized protein n=1 Tax=Purpureocillium lilacinum TaxID=33203 RepID=A0A2U3EC82_PURLI|nr:hypothetical protein PCL_10740 [Purpureocillium lilacinum]
MHTAPDWAVVACCRKLGRMGPAESHRRGAAGLTARIPRDETFPPRAAYVVDVRWAPLVEDRARRMEDRGPKIASAGLRRQGQDRIVSFRDTTWGLGCRVVVDPDGLREDAWRVELRIETARKGPKVALRHRARSRIGQVARDYVAAARRALSLSAVAGHVSDPFAADDETLTFASTSRDMKQQHAMWDCGSGCKGSTRPQSCLHDAAFEFLRDGVTQSLGLQHGPSMKLITRVVGRARKCLEEETRAAETRQGPRPRQSECFRPRRQAV